MRRVGKWVLNAVVYIPIVLIVLTLGTAYSMAPEGDVGQLLYLLEAMPSNLPGYFQAYILAAKIKAYSTQIIIGGAIWTFVVIVPYTIMRRLQSEQDN